MGRKRKHKSYIPSHINQNQIPGGVYFDPNRKDGGMWFTWTTSDEGKRLRLDLGGKELNLSDLHKHVELINKPVTEHFDWLAEKYFNSQKYGALKNETQRNYKSYHKKLWELDTKKKDVMVPQIPVIAWDTPLVQKLIDRILEERGPYAAKHTHSYLRTVFSYGIPRGYCTTNPAKGVDLPKVTPKVKAPKDDVYLRLIRYAEQYKIPIWAWMLEYAYLVRARGMEARLLCDSDLLDEGIHVRRGKGSKDTIIEWNDRLRAVIDASLDYRAGVWESHKMPFPFKPEYRHVFVNTRGNKLTESGYHSSWHRFITDAIAEGVITEEERFAPHAVKHKGTTDMPGNRHDKQEGTGWKNESMVDIYDESIPTSKASKE